MKTVAALFLVAASAVADDGSWSADRESTASPGALYSEAGAVPVVMEKEYLELTDVESGATKAVFQFRNTSNAPKTIECAFPIEVKFSYNQGISLGPKGVVSGSAGVPLIDIGSGSDKYGNDNSVGDSAEVWFKLLGLPLTPWNTDTLQADDEPMDDMPYGGQYLRLEQYPHGTKTYPADELASNFQLKLTLDGKPVALTTCVVDFGKEPGRLVFHFRHQMPLEAGGTARLVVNYAWPTLASESHEGGVRYGRHSFTSTWNYILETASSWQGKLGALVLAVPVGPQLKAPWTAIGVKNGRMLYQWKDAKPGPQDNLALSWSTSTRDFEGLWADKEVDRLEASPFREDSTKRYVGATSALADKADVFLEEGVMTAPFTGDRIFDGYRETAWGVHTAKGGVGESVSFVLKTPTGIVAVQNGYLRSVDDYPAKATASFYAKNNRVKKLSLVSASGTVTLDLADSRDTVQYFNVSLAPGAYQARIDAIYPGSKYNDTCLGELEFLPGNPQALAALEQDPFFSKSW